MKCIGLDLGGVSSTVCIRANNGDEILRGSIHPDRPSVVLFPLVRKETITAGDDALLDERGSGQSWPPVAMADSEGWSSKSPPSNSGRVLLAHVWQSLIEGGRWVDPQWPPPDGLPLLHKPIPVDCLIAETQAVLSKNNADGSSASVVLAIPNLLPEEAQDALITRLLYGARLIWRSVAVAMTWAEENCDHISAKTQLAVIDVGVFGIEISLFSFRREEAGGRAFQVPIRRMDRCHVIPTGCLLTDRPAPFNGLRLATEYDRNSARKVSDLISKHTNIVTCGALGNRLIESLRFYFPLGSWPDPNPQSVARGSALFSFRLSRNLPTYLDIHDR